MDRRNVVLFGLLALGGASVAAALFWPQSDEERVAEVLHGTAAAVGFSEPIENPVFFGSALADRLEEYLTERVDVQVYEVHGSRAPNERGQLAIASAMALSRYGSLDVSLSNIAVQLLPDGARATAEARVLASVGGSPQTESRRVHFELVREDGTFKVKRVQVDQAQ